MHNLRVIVVWSDNLTYSCILQHIYIQWDGDITPEMSSNDFSTDLKCLIFSNRTILR